MKKYKNRIIILGISILATIYFCHPYLNKLTIEAHDLEFHLARIQQIASEISMHKIPALIHSGLVSGLGYGNSLFYPEIFLYIPAIVHNLGISTITSYKIFIFIITWATFMSMFICTKKISKSNSISMVSTLLYTFSLYRIVDVYTRAAIGEVLVFIFFPLIILGCYELLIGNKQKWWILPLGVIGIANSHIISLAFSIGIILFFILINIKQIWKEKDRIKYIIIAGIVSTLLVLSVILPMLEQKNSNDYKVFKNGTSEELSTKSLIPTQVFLNEYQYGLAKVENNIINGQMNFGIGILLLTLPLCIFITNWKDKNEKKIIIQLFILGAISLFATTQLFPWQYFKFLNVIQVPWRLNIISTLCLSIVGAYTVYHSMEQKKEVMFIISIIIICIASNYFGKINYSDEQQIETEHISIGQGEYLPNIMVKETESYVFNIDNKEENIEYQKEGNKITFDITEENNAKKINIPLIFYKGYRATIKTQDDKEQELLLSCNEENGLTKLENEEQLKGTITIEYKMTTIQIVSYLITYLTLIVIIVYAIYTTLKKGRK